jgi:NADH-quinone oxidoreductase subunit L
VFGKKVPATAPESHNFFTVMGRNDLFGDTVNDTLVVAPTMAASRGLVAADRGLWDGGANGLAVLTAGVSERLRRLQNGQVRSYALTMTAGVVLVGLVVVLVQLG